MVKCNGAPRGTRPAVPRRGTISSSPSVADRVPGNPRRSSQPAQPAVPSRRPNGMARPEGLDRQFPEGGLSHHPLPWPTESRDPRQRSRRQQGQPRPSRRPNGMARPEGLEPPTYRFVVCRSIQLSYGRPMTVRSQESGITSGKLPHPKSELILREIAEICNGH